MMTAEYLKANQLQFQYELKAGTSTSYYMKEGRPGILPGRLGITRQTFRIVHRTRGHPERMTGQVKGAFTKKEESAYKKHSPFWIHTSIYEIPDFPVFIGYGDMGITSQTGRTEGTGDLLILHTSDQWQTISVHLFPGLLFEKDQVIPVLYKLITQRSQATRPGLFADIE